MQGLKVFIALLLSWLVLLGASIWHGGTQNRVKPADCIIVLGAAVQNTQPSPVFAERIRHAVTLYQQGFSQHIIFTGGIGDGQILAESVAAQQFAQGLGVAAQAIYREENSHTTQQNLVEAAAIMRRQGWQSAIIVSDPLHLKRAAWMAKDVGITAVTSPTPTTMYRSLGAKLTFLAREIYFLHYYAITGK